MANLEISFSVQYVSRTFNKRRIANKVNNQRDFLMSKYKNTLGVLI